MICKRSAFRRASLTVVVCVFLLVADSGLAADSDTAAFNETMRRYFPKSAINTVLYESDGAPLNRVYVCAEHPEISGTIYERILLDLKGLRYGYVNDQIRIESVSSATIGGSLTKAEFERVLAKEFPSLRSPKVTFSKKAIDIFGVYEKSYLVRVRALMRFRGRYEVDSKTGTAGLVFSDVTNDNAMVSAGEIAAALERCSPKLDFRFLPGNPPVRHVMVDENRIWFSTIAR